MKKFESDKDLISACLKCNPSAQRALYDRFVQPMYNTVYRYTCSHHDTQDILQNGFTRVFRHLRKFDDNKGNLLSWIRMIHIRCALDFLRKKKQTTFENIEETTALPGILPGIQEELEAECIMKIIEELNPRDRIIFNMHHIEGYSHEEIADLLSINKNSSRVYLARARKVLREKITAQQGRIAFVK